MLAAHPKNRVLRPQLSDAATLLYAPSELAADEISVPAEEPSELAAQEEVPADEAAEEPSQLADHQEVPADEPFLPSVEPPKKRSSRLREGAFARGRSASASPSRVV